MNDTHPERQILAIMFTDVVGYTAITERDEATAVRIRDSHRELVRTLVAQFDGEVVDVTGDESFSIFPSALRAVDCAIALQGALRSDPDLRLRIGVHLGDVLRKDGEVIGEGVNVAARIRPLAEPGGICVSEPVYQMVRSRVQVGARLLSAPKMKNVEHAVDVYALTTDGDAAAPSPARRSRLLVVAAGFVLVLLAVGWFARGPVLAWAALTIPRIVGGAVEQEVAFAESADGTRIAYATVGSGPPLVFVLGWATHLTEGIGSALYDRAEMLSWYSRDHRLVRFDGRGFGLSDRDVTDFSLDARVSDLEAVVDALGLELFDLFAYSAGGPVGVAYAARHPDRVNRLVLAATHVRPDEAALGRGAIAGLVEFLESGWESPAARAALTEFIAPRADEVDRRILMHFFQVAAEGPQIAGFLRAQAEIDTSDEARRIQAPTLVVASDADTTIPIASSRELASLIPGARFETIPGATHIGACGADLRVKQLVAEFLAAAAD